jgi:hypothetical protein
VKSRELTSGDPCCRGSPKYTYSVTSRDFVGDGGSFSDLAQRCEAVLKPRLEFGGSCLEMANCGLLSTVTGESTAPGEDPTGASAEREGGFGPQSKAGRAQGEYKGAREALARHARPHRPVVGWPGGVLRTKRTTQPSCMCSFDHI